MGSSNAVVLLLLVRSFGAPCYSLYRTLTEFSGPGNTLM